MRTFSIRFVKKLPIELVRTKERDAHSPFLKMMMSAGQPSAN
jgi:hypothetical protein